MANIDHIVAAKVTGYHARWPLDADTTARLRALREPQPVSLRFRDKYPALTFLGLLTLLLLCGAGVVVVLH